LQCVELIPFYEAVAEKSLRMLDAARENQWDELIQIEQERSQVLQKLIAIDSIDLGEAQLNKRKMELLESILKYDAETQLLAKSWMDELRSMLSNANVEKKLGNAYFSAE
jgi:flagellar protein FliT